MVKPMYPASLLLTEHPLWPGPGYLEEYNMGPKGKRMCKEKERKLKQSEVALDAGSPGK